MEIYWIIQLIIFGACIFEFVGNKKTKFQILALLCVIVTLFGGLRWNTGNDWYQYRELFQRSSWNNIFHLFRYQYGVNNETVEPGFVFINVLIKSIFGSFYWYNLVICGFLQYTYYKFVEYHCPKLPLLLYATIQLTAFLYFPVRAGLAAGVCLWAYRFIKEQKIYYFLLVVFIASSIHLQCIIFLPLYWVRYIKANPIIYLLLFLVLFVIGNSFQSYFRAIAFAFGGDIGEKFQRYVEYETEGAKVLSLFNTLLNFFLLSIYLYLPVKRVFGSEEWRNTLLFIFLFHQGVGFIFQDGMGDLARLKDPFNIVMPLLLVITVNYYINSNKQYVRIGSFLFYLIFIIRRMSNLGTDYYFNVTCIPYKTIFDYHFSLF